MKKTTYTSIVLLFIVFILSTSTASFCSSGNMDITMDSDAVLISRKNQLIYEKIDRLAEVKVASQQYLERYSDTFEQAMADPKFAAWQQEIEVLRTELTDMGAQLSQETLMDLFAPQTSIMNDDFNLEEFAALCGNAYEMWGVYQQVNASYGTYYVYDVVIQQRSNSDILSTELTQNGALGYEIYIDGQSTIADVLGPTILEAAFEGITSTLEQEGLDGIPFIGTLSVAFKTIKSIVDANNQLQDNAPIASSGNSRSYRIFCTNAPTLHFLFVKGSPNGAWTHTYTINSLTIKEIHDYRFIFWENGDFTNLSNEREYSYHNYHDRHSFMYTDAITAFRNNRFDKRLVDTYKIIAITSDTTAPVFVMPANCPATRDALYQIAITN